MLRGCPNCNAHDSEMNVDPERPLLVCPDCDHSRSFVRPTLCIVTGAAGVGKSTIRSEIGAEIDAVILEDDCVWNDAFESVPESAFNEYVLGRCANVAQSNVQPVLFTTGLGVPENVEGLNNRRYFGESHYLALVCDEETQAERLRARPGWGADGGYWADVDKQVEFNLWFKQNAERAGIHLVDTTDATAAQTAAEVNDWLRARI